MIQEERSPERRREFWLIFAALVVLAMIVRMVVLSSRLGGDFSDREIPFGAIGGSDIPGWLGMARHFVGTLRMDYWLLAARPPLFTLLLALIFKLGGSTATALVVQAMIGALTVGITYWLAARLLARTPIAQPDRWAVVAGAILIVDPAHVWISTSLLSDPLFNLLFAAFLLNMTRYVQDQRMFDVLLAALWMALAMLTRPTAIYLWIAAPLIFVPLVRRWWKPAAILAAVGLAVYLGWSYRNLQETGVFTYSLQTNFSLLFLRGLSAEHLVTGVPTDEIQVRYVRELFQIAGDPRAGDPDLNPDLMWEFLVAREPARYAAMGQIARRVLLRYWWGAVIGTPVGAWRMFAITTQLPSWFRPVELIYHALLYGLMGIGAWRGWRDKQWELLLITGVPIVYITGLTLVAQTSAMDTRMSTTILPSIVILAVYGAAMVQFPAGCQDSMSDKRGARDSSGASSSHF